MSFNYKRIPAYFVQGLVYLSPLAVTVFFIVWAFTTLDKLLTPIFEQWLPTHIPGLGIVLMFALVSLLGYIITRYISDSFVVWFDGLMKRAPGVKVVYTAVKDLTTVFFNKSEGMGRPVRIVVQRDPVQYKLGFITQTDLEAFGFGKDFISVYMPYSYGIMGNHMIVNRTDVELIDAPASQVMKFIVSGGVTKVEDEEHPHK